MPWSEDRIILWLAKRVRPAVLVGSSGHDAAVLRRDDRRTVTCVDQTIEGVHFETGVAPRKVGEKAVGRVLSDLAATSARPRAVLLALSAPREAKESWLREVIGGCDERGREFGAPLVGGDLSCAEGPVHVTVTGFGVLPDGGRPPGRDRARPGQRVVLTGPVGGSLLGRHLSVEPRLSEGQWLFTRGATAMMDVSDGLALDLMRMARASGVKILLESVPIHGDAKRRARRSGMDPLWHALNDGEDHELLATLSKGRMSRLLKEAPRKAPGLSVIGSVEEGRGLWIRDGDRLRRWRGEGGWLHGA